MKFLVLTVLSNVRQMFKCWSFVDFVHVINKTLECEDVLVTWEVSEALVMKVISGTLIRGRLGKKKNQKPRLILFIDELHVKDDDSSFVVRRFVMGVMATCLHYRNIFRLSFNG